MPKYAVLWLCIAFVLFLFMVDRGKKGGGSLSKWLVVAYVSIIASRAVSLWFDLGVSVVSPDDYLEGSPVDRNIFIGFLVVGILLLLKRNFSWEWMTGKNRWILLFVVYAGLSVLWSDYSFVAFKRWIKVIGLVVMALLLLTEEDPVEAVRWVFRRTAYILIPFSIVLIKYFPEFGRGYSYWTGAQYYTGVTTNKNALGTICFAYGIFFVWDWLALRRGVFSERRKGALINLIFLMMIGYLFRKANSATSLICFLSGTAILLALEMPGVRKNVGRFGVYLVTFMLLFGVLDFLFGIGESIVSGLGRDMTLTGRVEIWNEVISMSENTLFGSGHESFWLGQRAQRMWDKYYWRPNQAHNGYIEMYLHLGMVGLMLLLVMMFTGYKNILLKMISDHTLGSLKMTFFLTALLYNFAEAAFKLGLVWFIFILCCIDYEPETIQGLQHGASGRRFGLKRTGVSPARVPVVARRDGASVEPV